MEKLIQLLRKYRLLSIAMGFTILVSVLFNLDKPNPPEIKSQPLRTSTNAAEQKNSFSGNNDKSIKKADTNIDRYLSLPLRDPFEPPKIKPLAAGSGALIPSSTAPSIPMLKGILFVKGNYWAILQWQNQTTHYAIGAQLGPYKIQEINKNTVALKGNGGQLVLKL